MAEPEVPKKSKKVKKRAKKVVTQVTETIPPVHPLQGFTDFIRRQGVVGLAIGFVLGAQAKVLVDQFTLSFINPTLGLILPGEGNLETKKLVITVGDKTAVYNYGAFVTTFISFITVLIIIFLVFKYLKLDKLEKDAK